MTRITVIITILAAIALLLCSCARTAPEIDFSTIYTRADDASSPDYDPVEQPLYGRIIVLDPGHGSFDENYKEPVAPGSSELKNAFSTGAQGKKLTEAQFNLIISEKLGYVLEALGAEVHYTRTGDKSLSNVDRAVFANDLNADLAVRIHADAVSDASVSGITMLVPARGTIGSELESKSRAAGEAVLDRVIAATGAKNRGISERSDMTGFNWSEVPVYLIECGFLSNPDEDALLSDDAYQTKISNAMAQGIVDYFWE